MESITLIKEIKKRVKSLKLPLSCFLEALKINHSTYKMWTNGFLTPSKKSLNRLKEIFMILEAIEQANKREKDKKQEKVQRAPKNQPDQKKYPPFFLKQGYLNKEEGYFVIENQNYKIYKSLLDL